MNTTITTHTDLDSAINTLITAAIKPISNQGILPENATMYVFDSVSRQWEAYADGSTAERFARVIEQDSITSVYRGIRLVGYWGTHLVECVW